MAKKARPKDDGRRLPEDLVAHITRMVGVHLAAGNWERAIDAVNSAERMWHDRERELSDPTTDHFVLARHVSCLRLDARTVSQIDELCNGTVGSLVEIFPDSFLSLRGVGVQTIKTIASELCRIGAISGSACRIAVMKFKRSRIGD